MHSWAGMKAVRVGSVAGIPVKIHWSFLIALPLLALLFAENVATAARVVGADPRSLSGAPWLWGLGLTLALFLSVLVHELAHALYARRRGAGTATRAEANDEMRGSLRLAPTLRCAGPQ